MFTSNSRCLKSTQQSPEQPTGLRMSLQDQASGNTAIKQENLKVAFVHSCGLTNINNSPPTLRSSIKKQLWRPSSNPGAIYTTWATLSLTEDPQTKQSSPMFFSPYIQQEHSHAPQASLVFLVLLTLRAMCGTATAALPEALLSREVSPSAGSPGFLPLCCLESSFVGQHFLQQRLSSHLQLFLVLRTTPSTPTTARNNLNIG